MMISNNHGASVPPRQSDPVTFTVDDEQKVRTARKDYIEVARFLFGDNWRFTKKILTFVVDSGNIFNLYLTTPNAPELLRIDQLDDSIRPFVAELRHLDFVNTVWSDHPSAAEDIKGPATYPPRVIKLMKVLYDDAQWEYTKLALEWGFDRTNYTRTKNFAAEEVNSILRSYLDESCFDINEADVEATLDIVQAWDYYMSCNGDKISKFLDDIGDVDQD
ncbi:uncharacterized protein EAF01_011058 [Botrytis porri]|uniref:Uncharacterized protein n=1 Tax=Botrytis porri TaxID=87229 RepID=A0A4Z1KS67_9HELO|nr:uncharacterized protein EAF01_011058 [Botrytis porri]KAF7887904.1 hypothetical protein EAF01_011058 [Botrytis porri]TGO87694.1 hypothetical protein BPOR_0209g00020 [Botrytis porri]